MARRGKNHETIGVDVLALYGALQNPELVLGVEPAARIKALDPDTWYDVEFMQEQVRALAKTVGAAGLRKVGRTLFQRSHAHRVAGRNMTAYDLLSGLDGIYRTANRGDDIGGWRVVRFDAQSAELEDTTTHDCWLEEGILTEALKTIDVMARVEQTKCVKDGAKSCTFIVTPIKSDHWMR